MQGEIAIVMVDHEDAAAKRFYSSGTAVTLMPQSKDPAHKPHIYNLRQTHISVLGKVVEVKCMV